MSRFPDVEFHGEVVEWKDSLGDLEWDRTVIVIDRPEHGETTLANHSRWDDVKKKRSGPYAETRAHAEQDLALGQLIYDLRSAACLSQREVAERMGTTQSVISRLEEGGGARNRLDTLARFATALERHLVVSFPENVPARLKDAVQIV